MTKASVRLMEGTLNVRDSALLQRGRGPCHADSGLQPRWRSSSQGDEENQLQGVPVPSGYHPAGDLALRPVVTLLGDGSKRFNKLRCGLGSISQRMLTLTLKGLERDGLVTRTVFPTIPRRVDYELTKPGHSLLEPVSRLGHWARQNCAAIQAARCQFDAAKAGD